MKSRNFSMKLMGGLGNQMFQVAAAVFVSEHSNRGFSLDTTWYKERSDSGSHDSSPHVLRFPFLSQFPITEQSHLQYQINRAKNKLGFHGRRSTYIETALEYPEGFALPLNMNRYEGYFQTLNFLPKLDVHRTLFTLPSEIGVSPPIPPLVENMVALHLRLGDYLRSEIHPIASIDYINAALKYFQNQITISKVIVFSDSPEIVANFLPKNSNFEFEIAVKRDDPLLQLFEMAAYPNFIASASSFSWWVAYLNPENWEKTVTVPSGILKNTKVKFPKSRFPHTWKII